MAHDPTSAPRKRPLSSPRPDPSSGHGAEPGAGAEIGRGALLTGLGAAGLGLAAALTPSAAVAGPPDPRRTDSSETLPVLAADADWAEVLATTPQIQLDPAQRYVLDAPVELPSGTVIEGHGATVSVSSTGHGAFVIDQAENVTIRGVRLLGTESPALDVPLVVEHTAIRARRARNLRVIDCDLIGWQGAGIAATGDAADDYFSYGLQITGNRVEDCYLGISTADRCEYSVLAANVFTTCRLAIWNSAGNWNLTGNVIVGCYGAYYSIAATSAFGDHATDNWNHGSVTGCTMNHANGGSPRRWTAELAFPIGDTVRDPGPGVVLEGVLPPTFTGNTLWYTDVTARDLPASVWTLTGCTLSDLRITQDGGAPVRLVGHQSHAGEEHAPVLVGDAADALAP
ncbi:right-handed parallel beta-helix repeat-containing protein [Brachybacterium sp. 107]|uniref:right-handed parallel beta-helix repeat-containing protein n=1 Tax=Brachybacterium sp. 107 TaxID=3457736 RepID=UPI004034B5CA